jgi:hypothetical protein
MRWHVGTALALLTYSQSAQASGPYLYRRQDQQDGYNGTVVPARLPSASPTNYNVTSVTVEYAFVPETHSPITTSVPTVSVISTYLVISTFSEKISIQASPGNFTSSTTSEAIPSAATGRPYPISGAPSQSYVVPGNGTYPTAPKLSASQSGGAGASPRPKIVRPKPSNETCGGETLNVVNAHLDYWYTETYTHTVSTLSLQFNANDSQTGWTMLPATTEFDISTAISEHTCGPSTSLNTAYNRTSTRYDCYTTPTPVAASTTVLSVDAFTPASQTTGNGTDIPNLATEPPLAVATLPSAAGTFTEGTPFVYFSEFEIESSRPTTLPNGSDGCAVLTQSFMLNRLFSFAFEGDEEELSQESLMSMEGTSGDIDQSFARRVGLADSITVGTFSAQPTVIVVVERSVVAQAVLAGSTDRSQGGALITPEATVPSFLRPIATTTPTAPTTNYSPRVEQTADALDVPAKTAVKKFSRFGIFLAHLEHSETTLILPTATDTNVITTKIGGTVVTATALSNVLVDGANGNSGSGSSNGNANGNSGSNNGNGNANGGNSNGNAESNNGNGNGGNNNGNGAGNAGSEGDAVITGSVFSGTNVEDAGDDEGDWIMMPFVAHIENSAITLDVPAASTAEVVTAAFGGKVLTATALHAVETGSGNQNGGGSDHNAGGNNGAGSNGGDGGNNNGQNGGGGVFGSFVSAIVNAAKPTNAAEVLSQAMDQGHHDSTAAAIAAGIGGLAADAGASEGGKNGGNIGSAGGSNNGQAGSGSGSGFDSGSGSQFNSGSSSGSGSGSGSQFNSGSSSGSGSGSGSDSGFGSGFGSSSGSDSDSDSGSDSGSGFGSGSQLNSGSSSGAGSGSDSGSSSGSGSGSGSQIGSQFNSASDSSSDSDSESGSNVAFGGGSKIQLGASPGQVLTVDGATITASPANAFVVDGKTAVPGGAPITVDGTVISVPASANGIVVNGRTVPGEFSDSTVFNINGMAITALPGVGFPIAGQTLQAGGPAITVDGTRLSLAPGGTALVIGSSTSAITAAAGAASEIPELTIGSQTFTANAATQFFLAPGQTLTPGGTAVISGTTLSLESGASAIVVNGETRIFGSSSPDSMVTSSPSVIRVDGQAFAANAGGTYLISGQTLTPGGSITITGSNGAQTLSLSPSGTELVAVVSGHTITNTLSDSAAAADATAAPVLTIGGKTFTALPGSDGANPTYLINGETLSAGEEETVTVAGKTYVVSLAPEATLLEVEELGAGGKATMTRLQTLFPATATGRTSTMPGSGSDGNGDDDGETGTGTGTASPARKTGAANSLIGSSQFTSFFVAAGTLLLAGML